MDHFLPLIYCFSQSLSWNLIPGFVGYFKPLGGSSGLGSLYVFWMELPSSSLVHFRLPFFALAKSFLVAFLRK